MARAATGIRKGRGMTDTKLSPCPFCGGSASFGNVRYDPRTVREQEWKQDTFYYGSCEHCGSNNRGLVGFDTRELAALHWNRRVAPRTCDRGAMDSASGFYPEDEGSIPSGRANMAATPTKLSSGPSREGAVGSAATHSDESDVHEANGGAA